jgi:hypothetical protein
LHGNGGEIFRLDLQQRDVGRLIVSHQLGLEAPVIPGGDLHPGRPFHHMIIREHIAVLGIDNDARTRRLGFPPQALLGDVEQLPHHGIAQHRIVDDLDLPG